MHIKIS